MDSGQPGKDGPTGAAGPGLIKLLLSRTEGWRMWYYVNFLEISLYSIDNYALATWKLR